MMSCVFLPTAFASRGEEDAITQHHTKTSCRKWGAGGYCIRLTGSGLGATGENKENEENKDDSSTIEKEQLEMRCQIQLLFDMELL